MILTVRQVYDTVYCVSTISNTPPARELESDWGVSQATLDECHTLALEAWWQRKKDLVREDREWVEITRAYALARGLEFRERQWFDIDVLFQRDGKGCKLCGIAEAVRPVKDHVVPFASNGADDYVNLQVACWKCNSRKSDRYAGSLDHERLAEALAASPGFTGKIRYLPDV